MAITSNSESTKLDVGCRSDDCRHRPSADLACDLGTSQMIGKESGTELAVVAFSKHY